MDERPTGKINPYELHSEAAAAAVTFTAPEAEILVVDDNRMNLDVFRALLKKTRVRVMTATSGKECLRQVQKQEFDIIFLDHMMPEMDGVETLKQLKALSQESCTACEWAATISLSKTFSLEPSPAASFSLLSRTDSASWMVLKL